MHGDEPELTLEQFRCFEGFGKRFRLLRLNTEKLIQSEKSPGSGWVPFQEFSDGLRLAHVEAHTQQGFGFSQTFRQALLRGLQHFVDFLHLREQDFLAQFAICEVRIKHHILFDDDRPPAVVAGSCDEQVETRGTVQRRAAVEKGTLGSFGGTESVGKQASELGFATGLRDHKHPGFLRTGLPVA
ncbi:MAG: hypothetical protein ACLFVU_08865 [Phycisphaerae bacterium]